MTSSLVYVIDTLVLDVYINRSEFSDQSPSTKIRPCLTMCMEPVSKRVLASCFSEQRPGPESGKALLYEAFSASLPDEIWSDASLLFSSLQDLIQALHIIPCSIPPSAKGSIERLFLSLQNACFPRQDGSENRVIAESTLPEIEERFAQFLLHYHHQVQSSTGLTPLESWQEQCRPSAIDLHLLDLLCLENSQRRVLQDGIHYRRNIYWHTDLAGYLGKEVYIRIKPTHLPSETIEVFFEQQWICSASLLDTRNKNNVQEAE